jgi:hypothetical protein
MPNTLKTSLKISKVPPENIKAPTSGAFIFYLKKLFR